VSIVRRVQTFISDANRIFLKVTFWLTILLLVIVVPYWWLSPSPIRELSYSDFLQQIDKGNVRDAHVLLSKATLEVDGELRQTPERFHVWIPTGDAHEVMSHLQHAGVPTKSSENIPRSSLKYYASAGLMILPSIFIFVCWAILTRFKIRKLDVARERRSRQGTT